MTKKLALIVDDEPDIRELLEITLGRMNLGTRSAGDLHQARQLLSQFNFDLCLTDMRLPDGNGIELVEFITEQQPHLPVAVITAHGNMESAVLALKAGAFDFVSKPVDLGMLRKLVETALRVKGAPESGMPKDAPSSGTVMLGQSPAIKQLRKMISKLARSQAPVFISGESGTGKELAARQIHEQGPRAENGFIAVNCGAIPQELMESEFFGHKKGSFTGAVEDKQGLFQAAEGGTLFLDEVADLPLNMQVKLLRAIQEKSVRPVGAPQEIPVDVRIVSATHKNLVELVDACDFRQDLYYRINVIELLIPPLRDRKEDIPLFVAKSLERIAGPKGSPTILIGETTLKQLAQYDFPGNVRELENVLERATALCENNTIEVDDLQLPTTQSQLTHIETTVPEMPEGASLEQQLEQTERQIITQALEKTHWNKTKAAKILGISFRALRYRLSKLGLE